MVYVAVAVPTALGARLLGETAKSVRLSFTSSMERFVRVTFPVLVTVKV